MTFEQMLKDPLWFNRKAACGHAVWLMALPTIRPSYRFLARCVFHSPPCVSIDLEVDHEVGTTPEEVLVRAQIAYDAGIMRNK